MNHERETSQEREPRARRWPLRDYARKGTALLSLVSFYATLFSMPLFRAGGSGIVESSSLYAEEPGAPAPLGSPAPLLPARESRLLAQNVTTPPSQSGASVSVKHTQKVAARQAAKISHGGALLDIGAGAVERDTEFTVTVLSPADLPPLDPGLTNVTAGGSGYRFGPHGYRFKKAIGLTLPFDPALLPDGIGPDEVRPFYYNETERRWVPLRRLSVDGKASTTTSETDHFTDIINGTITVPEHPNPAQFNPTSLKDIKVSNPGQNLALIEAPGSKNTGDANLSYPIELPSGRGGLAPQIAAQYSSGGGNGWMGLGWDLSIPSITIETRWGVPRYDANVETETYLFNGQQLAPVAHRGNEESRAKAAQGQSVNDVVRTFYPRVEGSFQSIVRHGDSPSNYWWEVTEKSGLRHYYGGTPEGGEDGASILGTGSNGNSGNIFRWGLKETRDLFGNSVKYSYAHAAANGIESSTVNGFQLYIKKIAYTGNGAVQGAYAVDFTRQTELGVDPRKDAIVDGRGGFKQVTSDLLRRIEVRYNGSMVRSYEFIYTPGVFEKNLLQTIQQKDAAGVVAGTHTMGYFNETTGGGYMTAGDWGSPPNNLVDPLTLGKGKASAIGGGFSENTGIHMYNGAALGIKDMSVGFKVGGSFGTSHGASMLIDMNGDGLPDKLTRDIYGNVRLGINLSGPDGGNLTSFSVGVPLAIGDFSKERTLSYNFGGEAYALGGNVLTNTAYSFNMSEAQIVDANGDGLPDVAVNGIVYFNHPVNGYPVFVPTSAETPVPISRSAPANFEQYYPDLTAQLNEMKAKFPLMDAVRMWRAPFSGAVTVSGGVRLTDAQGCGGAKHDGVTVSVQHKANELWRYTIAATDHTEHMPALPASIAVNRGDSLYFRVDSIQNGECDLVDWAPAIHYTNIDPALVDANGLSRGNYGSVADFTPAGRESIITVPLAGSVSITGNLTTKSGISDDARLLVYQNSQVIHTANIPRTGAASVPLNLTVTVAAKDKLGFFVASDSQIDLTKIVWSPKIDYLSLADGSPVALPDGSPVITLPPAYWDASIYSTNDLTAPDMPYTIPLTALGSCSIEPKLTFDPLVNPIPDGRIIFTLKRNGEFVDRREFVVSGGVLIPPLDPIPMAIRVNVMPTDIKPGETIWIESFLPDPNPALQGAITSHFAEFRCSTWPVQQPSEIAGVTMHRATPRSTLLNTGWRGWHYFAYDANGDRSLLPLDEAAIAFNLTGSSQLSDTPVRPMSPSSSERWMGPDLQVTVTGLQISSSRQGIDDVSLPSASDIPTAQSPDSGGQGAVVLPNVSMTTSDSSGAGYSLPNAPPYVPGGSIQRTTSHTKGITGNTDLNGDRFPDSMVSDGYQTGVFLTKPTGEIGGGTLIPYPFRKSSNEADNAGVSGKFARNRQNARGGQTREDPADMASLGFSGSFGTSTSTTEADLIDMNGDGLPDLVSVVGGTVWVALNFGGSFGDPAIWLILPALKTKSREASLTLSPSYNSGNYGFAGGANITENAQDLTEQTQTMLQDVNGDGLTDLVEGTGSAINVYFNTGSGLNAFMAYGIGTGNGIKKSASVNYGIGAYYTISYLVFVTNPGTNTGRSVSRTETAFVDIDGDGFPDHLYSNDDGMLKVALSSIRRTNLLKSVSRPLGASIELDYTRTGNTFNMPSSRWVMSKVTVNDGHTGDGADSRIRRYSYGDPRYNRMERDFYGFASVIEEELDSVDPANSVYRKRTRTYRNDSYYTKGLLVSELLTDGANRRYTETQNTYEFYAVPSGAITTDLSSRVASIFPGMIRSQTFYYEGGAQSQKGRTEEYVYDPRGNVTTFRDLGEPGDLTDDVQATIAYSGNTNLYIVGRPTSISVTNNGLLVRKREADYDPANGALTQVRVFPATGAASVTDIAYFPNGNLKTVTGPASESGQRYALTYEYDPETGSLITKITDSFGYTSTSTYDHRFGAPLIVTDTNGNRQTFEYDALGRTVKIYGPYQTGTTQANIVAEYHPEAATPYAITKHYDGYANDPGVPSLDTVLFTDGIGRVIQTKKTAQININRNISGNLRIVSGRVKFDHAGREIERYYPVTEDFYYAAGEFNTMQDTVLPTRSEYDILDRVTKTTLPDGRFTTTAYGFGMDRNSNTMFQTTITDPMNRRKQVYRDVGDQITSIREYLGTAQLWTSYVYDGLNQITQVKDAKNNLTNITYDNLGRRTSIDNPDTGKIESLYDMAGNLTARITPNLRAQGKRISYTYDYNRLKQIIYPDNPQNNVTYAYGAVGDVFNRAGRISSVTDASGILAFEYGRMGETQKETRTVNTTPTPTTYATLYEWDSWGRMRTLTYPDGEKLTYYYDAGGLLYGIVGIAPDGTNTVYLVYMQYDKFGRRVYLEKGFASDTQYTYDPTSGRLTNVLTGSVDQPIVQNIAYGYDAADNITSIKNNIPAPAGGGAKGGPVTQTYVYDELDRMTSATGTFNTIDKYTLSMGYDEIHNIASKNQRRWIVQKNGSEKNDPATTYNWTYAYGSTRPHAPTNIGGVPYTYDLNGNQTGFVNPNVTRIISWDEENRIKSIADNGSTATYLYDYNDQRIIKRTSQGETVYLNQFYTVRNGSIYTKHIFAGTERIATRVKTTRDNFVYYYHPDQVGSTNYVTDAAGATYEHMEYFPFGELWVSERSSTEKTPYLFSSKELDEDTKLSYFGARYLDSRTSVWQSADGAFDKYLPEDDSSRLPGRGGIYNSANLGVYTYAHQNPIKLSDPDGNAADTALDIFFIGKDIYDLSKDPSKENAVALMFDVAGALIPFATGLGAIYKTGKALERSIEAGRALDKSMDAAKAGDKANEARQTAKQLAGKGTPCSFAEGTDVITKEGSVDIEKLKEGDWVLAKNEQTGEEDWRRVTAVFVNQHDHLIALDIEHADGSIEKILTTDHHPFYVQGEGWVKGIDLEKGNRLVLRDKGVARVVGYSIVNKSALAWNLEVEDFHTFFVGERGVWVHNGNRPCSVDIDNTGKVHGELPEKKDVKKMRTEDLKESIEALGQSSQTRTQKTKELGADSGHSERSRVEANLLKSMQKELESRTGSKVPDGE